MRKLCLMLVVSPMLLCFVAGLARSVFASAPTSTPCIQIGNSTCSILPATGNAVVYSFAQGTPVQIKGQRWAAQAAIELYLLPASSSPSAMGNSAPCPSQSAMAASSIAHSGQEMTDLDGNFSQRLTLPATLKVNALYNMCISVTSSARVTATLLFQINVIANAQQQTDKAPTNGSAAPFSFNLSIIALALALVSLLLFFISPRQSAAPHSTRRRIAS